jgi:hypothetical protein
VLPDTFGFRAVSNPCNVIDLIMSVTLYRYGGFPGDGF